MIDLLPLTQLAPATPLPTTGAATPAAARPAADAKWDPPAGWPRLAQLSYVKEAITALLLLLTLPYVVLKLVTRPRTIITDLGRKHVKP